MVDTRPPVCGDTENYLPLGLSSSSPVQSLYCTYVVLYSTYLGCFRFIQGIVMYLPSFTFNPLARYLGIFRSGKWR